MNNINDLQNKGYFVGIIDGADCKDLASSLSKIATAFQFPDYYGKNLDAFWDCINDLEWLNKNNYAILIQNSNLFMVDDTKANRLYLMNMLDEVSKEWAKVPNFQNEDAFRNKADFKIFYN